MDCFCCLYEKDTKYYYSHTYHELLDSPIFFPDHSMHKKTSLQIITSKDYRNSTVTNISCLLMVSIHHHEKRAWELKGIMYHRRNHLIFITNVQICKVYRSCQLRRIWKEVIFLAQISGISWSTGKELINCSERHHFV